MPVDIGIVILGTLLGNALGAIVFSRTRHPKATVVETCAWCDDHWTITGTSAAEVNLALDRLRERHEARWHGAEIAAAAVERAGDATAERDLMRRRGEQDPEGTL